MLLPGSLEASPVLLLGCLSGASEEVFLQISFGTQTSAALN